MDNWRKNRWTIFYYIIWVLIAMEAILAWQMIAPLSDLGSFVRLLTWLDRILALATMFFVIGVIRFFRESRNIIYTIYVLLVTTILSFVLKNALFMGIFGFIGFAAYVYYIVRLFSIKSPEIAPQFRKLAFLDIAYILTQIAATILAAKHWTGRGTSGAVPFLMAIPTNVVLLSITNIMRRSDGVSSVEKDIASIGEPTMD